MTAVAFVELLAGPHFRSRITGNEMRAVILVLVIAIIAIIAAIASGFLDINQTAAAQAPSISRTENGVRPRAGRRRRSMSRRARSRSAPSRAMCRSRSFRSSARQNQAAPVTNNAQ